MSRRFQFSLRALLVAMLVVGAFFGGMALQSQLASREMKAIRLNLENHRREINELRGGAWPTDRTVQQ
jgi:hypothetical protein